MVQVALKEAVNVMIATQQYDIAKCQYYVQGFMEIMTKAAGMTVEAAAPAHPQASPVAQPMAPTNGHQQPVNRVAQYVPQQQPQQVYQQQPQQYAQAPQQQYIEPGMSEGDYVPF